MFQNNSEFEYGVQLKMKMKNAKGGKIHVQYVINMLLHNMDLIITYE